MHVITRTIFTTSLCASVLSMAVAPLWAVERPITFYTPTEPRSAPSVTAPPSASRPAANLAVTTDPRPTAFRRQANRVPSTWETQPPLQAGTGETALAGLVLTLEGQPLANVTLLVEERDGRHTTLSDATGRFLLPLSASGSHRLVIDGRSVAQPGKAFGLFEVKVDVLAGQTKVLPYTIWMPDLDMAHAITIPSPTDTELVITNPRLPGLELHIPPRTVIKDREGNLVTQISLTPIPVDQPPFPLPPAADVPVYFTIQPGGATMENSTWEGMRLIYPNSYKEPPGTAVDFYNYDPEEKGWYIYGQGAVSPDGKRVVPGPDVAICEFTGAMVANPAFAPAKGPKKAAKGGDPVDLATGLFVMEKTDLAVDDIMPIAITRTYRQDDARSRAFGIGASHPYDMFLVGDTFPYTYTDLILADGSRHHFTRISPGTGFADAVYEHTETQSRFYKAQIGWNGTGWDLVLREGGAYKFREGFNATSPAGSAVIWVLDRNSNAIQLIRNATTNNLEAIVSPSGRTISLTYDTSNRITQATDNAGRVVTYTYDNSGRLKSVKDPSGNSTSYTYDTSHRMLTIKDPKNITYLTNLYDVNGRVTKQTQADATTFQFAYTLDANGNVTRTDVTDPRGTIRRVNFNAAGYPLSEVLALGKPEQQTLTYERDSATNFLLSTTDALSRKTVFTYDGLGSVLTKTALFGTPEAVTTTMTYTPINYARLLSVTDPLNHTTTFAYDSERLGNLITVTNALNQTTTMTYDTRGLAQSVIDPLTHTTTLTYADADLAGTTDPLGRTTTRFTDALGRVLSVTSPLNTKTQSEYDALNQVTKLTDASNGATAFTYDLNGNLLTLKDAKTQTTTYTYDSMDRVATRKNPLLKTESYLYDGNGNLTKLTDRKAQITNYTYDVLDRRTKTTFHDSTSTNYTYDAGNRLTQIQEKNAAGTVTATITPTYDTLDRLTREVTAQGTVDYAYDTAGRRTSMTVQGQLTVNYTYDNANRLIQITQGTSTVLMGYDAAGRRTSLTLPTGLVVTAGFDNASQLTSVSYQQGATLLGDLQYVYDSRGNRMRTGGSWGRTGLPPAIASTIVNANNQMTTFGATTLTYDLNGNVTTAADSFGTATYTWDVRNRLTGLTSPGFSASFAYDSLGRRTGKTVQGVTTNFVYDGLNPVQEKNGATVTANLLTGLGIDEFLTRTDGAGTRGLVTEALGSTVALTDNTGTVQTQYTYEPFGYATAAGQANTNSYKYTGREDDGTGLYYYRARYYSPRLQRFVSEDPIGFEGGDVNLYAYVNQNPVLQNDPSGLLGFPGAAGLGCGLGATAGLGARKPIIGGGVGGLIGCSLSPLIIALPPGPLSAGLGAYLGALAGAASAGAGGGSARDVAIAAAAGALGGAVGGVLNPILGAVAGAAVAAGVQYYWSP